MNDEFLFGRKTFHTIVKGAINDFEVSQVTTAKSLGVTIDDRLDWSGHIEKVTKKVASVINWGHKTIKAPCPSGDLTTNISSFNTATL